MGRVAGIVLASLGLIIALPSAAAYASSIRAILSPPTGGGWIAGLGVGIALLFGLAGFIISAVFYLASYLASRRVRSRAIGALFIIGGAAMLIALLAAAITLLPRFSGPLGELLLPAGLAAVQAAIALLIVAAGIRAARRA